MVVQCSPTGVKPAPAVEVGQKDSANIHTTCTDWFLFFVNKDLADMNVVFVGVNIQGSISNRLSYISKAYFRMGKA